MLLQKTFFFLVVELTVLLDCPDELVVLGANIAVIIDRELGCLPRVDYITTLVEMFCHLCLHLQHLLASLLVKLAFTIGGVFKQLFLLSLVIFILLLFLPVDSFHLFLDLELDLFVVNFATISQQIQVEPVHLRSCRVRVQNVD